VIVELVSRTGEATRTVNQQLDGIMTYLEDIGYPKKQRMIYKSYFWKCRPYLLHQYYLDELPKLSPEVRRLPC
jgi:hypothetical protein